MSNSRLIQRSVEECQHSFKILIDVFIHAEQGILQPQLIPMKKIRNYIMKQKLPSGTDYPNFPFPEILKIISPSIYSYKKYLVYVLEIPLIFPTEYHLYKLIPFPVVVNKEEATYGYINLNKELISSDSLQRHYGKRNINELMKCFQPRQMVYLCKAEIPISTYVPEMDCEATLLQPSTVEVPKIC
jgi:hypothetical protein